MKQRRRRGARIVEAGAEGMAERISQMGASQGRLLDRRGAPKETMERKRRR